MARSPFYHGAARPKIKNPPRDAIFDQRQRPRSDCRPIANAYFAFVSDLPTFVQWTGKKCIFALKYHDQI